MLIDESVVKKCRTKMVWQIVGGVYLLIGDVSGVEMVIESLNGTGENELYVSIITCAILMGLTSLSFLSAIKNMRVINVCKKYRIFLSKINDISTLDMESLGEQLNIPKQKVSKEISLLMDKGIIKNLSMEEINLCEKQNLKEEKPNSADKDVNNSCNLISSQEYDVKDEIDIFDIK